MLPSIILNVIFFIVAWMFGSKWFKIKVHTDIRNSNTSSILFKAIMSSQNSMAKESSSLQNHIVWSCFHFRHTRMLSSCTPPMTSQAIVSYFSILKPFQLFTQYMSVSHGHSTMGGIEYDDGGCVEKTKKRIKSHIDEDNQRVMEMSINWCQHEE